MQIFHPSTNTISRVSLFGALFAVCGAFWMGIVLTRSPYVTRAEVPRNQPVPFSHAHHVGDIGLDCRYCHTSVENSSFAGIPPTATCMNCHSQLFKDSEMLEPVRASYRTGKPLVWTRVNDLPDFVYFNHGIHIKKGVACVVCHGRLDKMALTWQQASLQMEWCINCHRHPEKYIRPPEAVFLMNWQPPDDDPSYGLKLMKRLNVKTRTDCDTCHR